MLNVALALIIQKDCWFELQYKPTTKKIPGNNLKPITLRKVQEYLMLT